MIIDSGKKYINLIYFLVSVDLSFANLCDSVIKEKINLEENRVL